MNRWLGRYGDDLQSRCGAGVGHQVGLCIIKKLFDIYDLEYVISRGYLMTYIYNVYTHYMFIYIYIYIILDSSDICVYSDISNICYLMYLIYVGIWKKKQRVFLAESAVALQPAWTCDQRKCFT